LFVSFFGERFKTKRSKIQKQQTRIQQQNNKHKHRESVCLVLLRVEQLKSAFGFEEKAKLVLSRKKIVTNNNKIEPKRNLFPTGTKQKFKKMTTKQKTSRELDFYFDRPCVAVFFLNTTARKEQCGSERETHQLEGRKPSSYRTKQ